jgi:hypothetical protein
VVWIFGKQQDYLAANSLLGERKIVAGLELLPCPREGRGERPGKTLLGKGKFRGNLIGRIIASYQLLRCVN